MPQYPKPFYRVPRARWFVQIGKKQINLGPDKAEAFRRYHELMHRPHEPGRGPSSLVLVVLDWFLDWCEKHRAPRTYDWYRDYLQSFVSTLPADLKVSDLKPFHVQQWVDSQPGWKTGKRGAIIAVQRAFNWAAKMGLIETSPVRYVEKPQAGRRDVVITPEEYAWILAQVKDVEFRDLLTVCWETGCRPQEVLSVEARHTDVMGGRWVFPPKESKGKKRHRVVYLTEAALEITRRLIARWPQGPIFRNTDGKPWHPYALNCRFARLRLTSGKERVEEMGALPARPKRLCGPARLDAGAKKVHADKMDARRREIRRLCFEHGKRWCLYHFRHSFATRLLESGVDALTVSALLGHADGAMLAKVYSHLARNGEYLRASLKTASI